MQHRPKKYLDIDGHKFLAEFPTPILYVSTYTKDYRCHTLTVIQLQSFKLSRVKDIHQMILYLFLKILSLGSNIFITGMADRLTRDKEKGEKYPRPPPHD